MGLDKGNAPKLTNDIGAGLLESLRHRGSVLALLSSLSLFSFGSASCKREDFFKDKTPDPTSQVDLKNNDGEYYLVSNDYGKETEIKLSKKFLGEIRHQSLSDNLADPALARYVTGDSLSKAIANAVTAQDKNAESKAVHLLRWVRNKIEIAPTVDSDSKRLQTPAQTILAGRGTAREATLLFSSLCESAGLDVVVLGYKDKLACGVAGDFSGTRYHYRGKDFYYVDVTANPDKKISKSTFGKMPPAVKQHSEADIYGNWVDAAITFSNASGETYRADIPAQSVTSLENSSFPRNPWEMRKDECIRHYVTYDQQLIKEIAQILSKGSKSQEEVANRILDFVHQQVSYANDPLVPGTTERGEYYKYPIQTLVDGEGDCEDSAFLYAALCKAAGLDVVVLNLPGHMAVGVAGEFEGTYYDFDGKQYYFAETTGGSNANNQVGDFCDNKDDRARIIFI